MTEEEWRFVRAARCIQCFGNNAFGVSIVRAAEQGDLRRIRQIRNQLQKPDRTLTKNAYRFGVQINSSGNPSESPHSSKKERNPPLGKSEICESIRRQMGFEPPYLPSKKERRKLKDDSDVEAWLRKQTRSELKHNPTEEEKRNHPLDELDCRSWLEREIVEKGFTVVDCVLVHKCVESSEDDRLLCFVFQYCPGYAFGIGAGEIRPPIRTNRVDEIFEGLDKKPPFKARLRESEVLTRQTMMWIIDCLKNGDSWKKILTEGQRTGAIPDDWNVDTFRSHMNRHAKRYGLGLSYDATKRKRGRRK